MPLSPEVVLENSNSWLHYFKEYNEAISMLGERIEPSHPEKLKEKIGDPNVREQLKKCVEARGCLDASLEHRKKDDNPSSLEAIRHANWRFSTTIEKLDMLLYDFKYTTSTYQQFCLRLDDDMEDAWMESDSDSDERYYADTPYPEDYMLQHPELFNTSEDSFESLPQTFEISA